MIRHGNFNYIYAAFLVLIVFVFTVKAQQNSGDQTEAPVPHFFPEGIVRETVPAKQYAEYLRYVNATQSKLANWHGESFIVGNSIVVEKEYYGKKIKIVFSQHVKDEKGVRYTFFNDQGYITEQEFGEMASYFDQEITKAVELCFKWWGDLEQKAVEAAAKVYFEKDPKDNLTSEEVKEFREMLDKEDPIHPGMTFREIRALPEKIEKKDFLPNKLYITLTPQRPSVLGVSYTNVGLVYYTPVAAILDYLTGTAEVLAHEFIHTNTKLQKMPMIWGFDAETMASIPGMLMDKDHLRLWFHGYASLFREFAWVYGNFDFDQAREEITRYQKGRTGLMGNVFLNEEKFNDYSTKLNIIKKEFRHFFMDVAIPKFYSEPVGWTAMNDKLVDDNAVFYIMMAAHYNPTLLGGEEKTIKWLEANKYKIKLMAERAWKESGASDNHTLEFMGEQNTRDARIASTLFSEIVKHHNITQEDVDEFLLFYNTSPIEIFMNWKPEQLKKSVQEFVSQRKSKRRLQ